VKDDLERKRTPALAGVFAARGSLHRAANFKGGANTIKCLNCGAASLICWRRAA
jgi:hypothetical protein